MSTETTTSEWTLLNYGDEEEEIEVIGFSLTNVDGVTTLDYDSDFSFHMSTTVETTGPGTSIEIDTVVNSTNISEVDSTHTTHDTYLVERELEEGEVVETKTRHYSGSFSTDADMVSSTDVEGSHDLSFGSSGGGGGGGGGGPPGPPTSTTSGSAHMAWTDHRDSTTTTTAQQSGSYGDGENDSSSSSVSITSVDEYFSTLEGDSHFEIDDYEIFGEFTYESEGRSERQFTDAKSYSSSGNSASWSTSFETESSWSLHSEVTEFGYTCSAASNSYGGAFLKVVLVRTVVSDRSPSAVANSSKQSL